MSDIVLLRGGGDLASGVALRLHHAGFDTIITELPEPLAVRRAVSFSEAVYEGVWTVEDVTARRVQTRAEVFACLAHREIPVLVDPDLEIIPSLGLGISALIDARLLKQTAPSLRENYPLVIGLGPGFTAGENCHAVIETQRGHTLGRVYWHGAASPDSGRPEGDPRRVLRAPCDGIVIGCAQIGDHLEAGEMIAQVEGEAIRAPFAGVLRGLIRPGMQVKQGLKIGDLDPRDQRAYCFLVSDKALAIGGGVLEALLQFQRSKK
ncbi:MAG: selenium-dependent molybdenum cofactor biosynthesis protein YqeB [Anaerolineales bacterium]|nr:selenium-dependent molybdenum cofactor biosynthesis protein YqeB [Anaerolineales bacterium]MCX7756173.1 selenium-dependent molybdenum cofactor biosynthesis protein YqeB [Anaerolineales bacterium]MDW8276925.1 selenium-dependent molybdenum cofactor biosynthesis protein YqeB [Anaerolineales bacterium]